MPALPTLTDPVHVVKEGFELLFDRAARRISSDRSPAGHALELLFGHIAPASCSRQRISTRVPLFMSSSCTVARPIGVRPIITGPSKQKCSDQMSCRGLKSATRCPVSGSILVRFGPLCALQSGQASARLDESSLPPCCRAVMCSIWKVRKGAAAWSKRQYSHLNAARRRTKSRSDASIYELGCSVRSLRAFA